MKPFVITAMLICTTALLYAAPIAPLPEAISRPAAALVHGELYVCGGERGSDLELTDACYWYDSDADAWESIAPLPEPLANSCGVAYDEKFLVVGGFDGTTPTESTYVYSPDSDSWIESLSLPQPLHAASCVETNDGIYLAGGIGADETFLDTVYYLGPFDADWSEVGRLHEPVAFFGIAPQDNSLIIVGGMTAKGETELAYEWIPDSGIKSLPALPEPRAGLALLPYGESLIAVGGGNWNAPLGSSRVLDSNADDWLEGPALLDPRRTFAAVASIDYIYVAGGYDGADFLASAEMLEVTPLDDDDDNDDDNDTDEHNHDDDDDDDNSGGCCG
jgi:Kelch motif protein